MLDRPEYFCRFGLNPKAAASYTDVDTLRCNAPEQQTGEPLVVLSVTINDQDYVPVADFLYYPPVEISIIFPTTGPTDGGSQFSVTATVCIIQNTTIISRTVSIV